MKNKRFIGILIAIATILSIPLIGMQFSSEVDWSLFDFTVVGGLLLATGAACEMTLRSIKKKQFKFIICLGILALFSIVWIELAVGILGTPFAGS